MLVAYFVVRSISVWRGRNFIVILRKNKENDYVATLSEFFCACSLESVNI